MAFVKETSVDKDILFMESDVENIIRFIIQNRMTVDVLLTSQIGTHPLLTGPPTAYPLIKAAEIIAKKRRENGAK